MRRAKAILLVPILTLASCAGSMRHDHRPATAYGWDFDFRGNPTAVSVADIAEIRNRARTSAFDHSRIVKMEVVDADTVWVRRGDRFGGPSEYWTRKHGEWDKTTPPNLAGGSRLYWAPGNADEQWGFNRVALPPRREQATPSYASVVQPSAPPRSPAYSQSYRPSEVVVNRPAQSAPIAAPAPRQVAYAPVQHAPIDDAAFLREEIEPASHRTSERAQQLYAERAPVAAERTPTEWQPSPVLVKAHTAPVHTTVAARPTAIISNPPPIAARQATIASAEPISKPASITVKPAVATVKTHVEATAARQARIATRSTVSKPAAKPEIKPVMLTAPKPLKDAPLVPKFEPFQ